MLPSRTRLQGWNPVGQETGSGPITSGGAAVESAVATIASNCRTLPDLHGWSGESHDAAAAAFDRSKRPAATIADAAEAIGKSLIVGSHAVGTARSQLLDRASAALGAAGAAAAGPAAPVGAGIGAVAGTWIFGKLGDELGQMVCAK